MKIFKWIIFLSMLVDMSFLQAQIAGNPIETKGEGEWTVSAAANYVNMGLGQETVSSRRLLVKNAWGLTDRIDIYGLVGAVRLNMELDRKNVSDYQGKYEFGYGIGFNTVLKSISDVNRVGVWCGAQVLRFSSDGKFIESSQVTEGSFCYEYEMKYDWNEVHGYLGIVYPYRYFRFYAAAAGFLIQRSDEKKDYIVYADEKEYLGENEDTYRSGLWTGGVVGVEINLSNRFVFSIEGLVFNERNYQIKIGICQTGVTKW